MSMHLKNIPGIPQETVDVARASFPKGNIYMQIRDSLGSIFEEEAFVNLFPTNGQPAYAPWRLALVCIMQFMENLSDRQAASSYVVALAAAVVGAPMQCAAALDAGALPPQPCDNTVQLKLKVL